MNYSAKRGPAGWLSLFVATHLHVIDNHLEEPGQRGAVPVQDPPSLRVTPTLTTVQVDDAEERPPSLKEDTEETEPPSVGDVGGEYDTGEEQAEAAFSLVPALLEPALGSDSCFLTRTSLLTALPSGAPGPL
ncbi:hypothetical protein E2C01_032253 [Portunus trituberculatus]|uniref:Uncharacterized protein n=1 Tax=Portunus trituberculatus TaxID=210409 RepID=A0A5B7EUW0_PORTR|nr:hypothetical protein [Portunus trituberculatus]